MRPTTLADLATERGERPPEGAATRPSRN
ncbi:hypothetical protein ACFWWT_15135 [Streptomyces sp. NPDC058676]